MKIEVGKTYVTDIGSLRRVISLDGPHSWPIVTVNECNDLVILYDKNGTGRHNKLVSEFDPWPEVKVDTPIWVRDRPGDSWTPRHFVKYENGEVYTWADGGTQHTASVKRDPCTGWKYATLVNPDLLKGEPKC